MEINSVHLSLLQSGVYYILGRDKSMRPLLFINYRKLIYLDSKVLQTLAFFIVEYMQKYLLVEETIENFNIIVNCTSLNFLTFPKSGD